MPRIEPGQQKPLVKMLNRALKAKLPRLFSRGKHIEHSSNVKIGHKKKKQTQTKYW